LNAANFMQSPPSGEGGGLAPIEGTGDVKTRGLSAGIEQKAIARELTDWLGELPQYKTANMAEHAAKATALLRDDPALARQVALGEVDAPRGMIPESVLVAVENRAIQEGDVATIRDLANSKLAEQATVMGQRIRTLAERNPDSPVSAIEKIQKLRGGGKEAVKATTDELANLNSLLDEGAKQIDQPAWAKFLDSIVC
jgi:hypothetical protein